MGGATDNVHVLEASGSSVDLEKIVELHTPVWKGGSSMRVDKVRSDDTHGRRGH